ncbi:hypothetical protein BDZ97DRAFT_1924733 [Flammula alnicola]|nr:hypothetical protein BDZ97DRAFT_1924733 [Flammula alnicola]
MGYADVHRDHDSLLFAPLDLYAAYPELTTASQKMEALESLSMEIRGYLTSAIASLSNVEEITWQVYENEDPDWFRTSVCDGLASLKKITTASRGMLPFFGRLTTLNHFEHDLERFHLPPDHDDFWRCLKTANVKLLSLRSNAVTMAALDYLGSYYRAAILRQSQVVGALSFRGMWALYRFSNFISAHPESFCIRQDDAILSCGLSPPRLSPRKMLAKYPASLIVS